MNELNYSNEEYIMALIVRTDLKMGKGKVASQCAHAALACYKSALHHSMSNIHQWEHQNQAKVVMKVDSENTLYELQALAISHGLDAKVIIDAGKTQIAPNSATVLGVGPGPASLINRVTGKLKLY